MADKKALIEQCLGATKGLRSSISHVFEGLVEQPADNKSSESAEAAKTSEFVERLKKNLVDVQTSYGALEKSAALVSQVIKSDNSIALGNAGLLTLDPIEDKNRFYGQLLDAYNWHEKLNTEAKQAAASLKRQHPYAVRRTDDGPIKRPRPPLTPNILEALKAKHINLRVSGYRICGSTALEVTVPKTFKAIIMLKGVGIDQVKIRGLYECSLMEKKDDIWSPSKHIVFQKLTDYANGAALHYYNSAEPFTQILCLMKWLDSFHGMFSRKCTKCNQHLKEESENALLPPCWRTMDALLPYHYSCKPQS
ncbi:mediator of RNA polymerase II transcription subunit 27 [Nematostella vectensis]|uniref:mediator of RNA polymerase II transcription subunit 27 n=1 Tax=Nematostella vectensis TaxID=45351 RepID=UPI0020774530|nr:mediator of RNA polymerase II transcription subunit 27 [Nematostella vectensis]